MENHNQNPNSKNPATNSWAQMATEVPPLAEQSPESIDQRSKDLLKGFLEQNEVNSTQDYAKLSEYANLRGQNLQISKPINLYLRRDFWQDGRRNRLRYSPETNTPFPGEWSWLTRAFHSEQGTHMDFPALPQMEGNKPLAEQTEQPLQGYEAADALVDFAYTCEHELQHDLQDQRLAAKEISYDTLQLAKDRIFLNLLGYFSGDAQYFYHNAHNDLFIEKDANAAADEFFDQILPVDSILARQIVNPNAPPEHQHNLFSVLTRRQKEGAPTNKNYSLTLSKNDIKMPEKTYAGTAEEIVSDFCDDVLQIYPDFIKLHPTLLLEYNPDGSRRSLADLEDSDAATATASEVNLSGQTLPAKRVHTFYHRLIKNSRKLQAEKAATRDS